jgi:rRNA-processing protein EBP2
MTASMEWIETLDLYGPTLAYDIKPDQTIELEKKMYEAALLSAKEGYRRLSALKVPASRRTDYYAEMLKDDKQMTKIRTQLVTAQQRIEAVEARKKKQAHRKFSKQMKAAKIEKRKQEKINEKVAKDNMRKESAKKVTSHDDTGASKRGRGSIRKGDSKRTKSGNQAKGSKFGKSMKFGGKPKGGFSKGGKGKGGRPGRR